MEPELTAHGLLAEVQSETLQTLLVSVRRDDTADDHNMPHPEPAKPLFSHGNVVELQGPPGSGKTQLVYDAIISCILPEHCGDIHLGGWNQAAIVLDTDESFDIYRLCRLLDAKTEASAGKDRALDDSDIVTIREEALRNFHIFHPQSSFQLAATILNLPRYHWDESHLQHREIGLVAVDSLSTFYWEDRFTVEQLRGGQSFSEADVRTPFRHVITALDKLRSAYHPLILVTNWGLSPLVRDVPPSIEYPYFRQHLYPTAPGISGIVSGENVTQAPTMSEFRQTIPASSAARTDTRVASRALATLPITHHITLLPYPRQSDPPIQGIREDNTPPRGTDSNRSRGFIRRPNGATAAEFMLYVGDTGVILEQSDIFRG